MPVARKEIAKQALSKAKLNLPSNLILVGQNSKMAYVPKDSTHAHNWVSFFGYNSAIYWPIGVKFILGTQETLIIYQLVMINPGYVAYFSFLIFWATFGGKMGMATTCTPNRLGLQTRPNNWPTGWNFWANNYLEIKFSKLFGLNHNSPLNLIFKLLDEVKLEVGSVRNF